MLPVTPAAFDALRQPLERPSASAGSRSPRPSAGCSPTWQARRKGPSAARAMILRSVALIATASALQRLPAPLARRRGLNGMRSRGTVLRVLDVPVDAENSVSELAELIADLGAADLNARPPAPLPVLRNRTTNCSLRS